MTFNYFYENRIHVLTQANLVISISNVNNFLKKVNANMMCLNSGLIILNRIEIKNLNF